MRGVSIIALALVTFVCLSEANNHADGPHWSQWEVFGKSCKQKKCGKNNERWKRRCIGGKTKECGGSKNKFLECVDLPPCATWGNWVPFKKCSAKCGDGEQQYKRKCNRLKAGRKCPGGKEAKIKTGTCNNGPCAVWSAWTAGECSVSCGAGTSKETRECQAGIGKCDGEKGGAVQERNEECNKGACATWGAWKHGACSVTCGQGTIKSTRECEGLGDCDGVGEKSTVCKKRACATWGAWKYGACSATCGQGTIKSTRECEGLGDCDGVGEKTTVCKIRACATWGAWKHGACSVTCGQGTIKSTRECEGLGDCDGVGEKSTVCKKRACSVEIRKTSLSNADGGGDALYLDRHPVYCNVGEALSQFRLQKTTQNHMQYRYSCLTNSGSSGSVAKQSAFDMDGNVGRGMESFFLDRHEVDCGNSGILSSFRLQRNAGHGKIRYKYVCNTYSHTLTCHDKTTPWNDAGNGNVIYLDRHHLSCISGTALSRFRLQRSGNTIRYNYRCCPI